MHLLFEAEIIYMMQYIEIQYITFSYSSCTLKHAPCIRENRLQVSRVHNTNIQLSTASTIPIFVSN